jgi:hypothetical protein
MHKQAPLKTQKATKAKKVAKKAVTQQKKKIVTKSKKVLNNSTISVLSAPISPAVQLRTNQRRKFTAQATTPTPQDYQAELDNVHANFTDQEKDEYNEWLFAKMSPILRRSLYASFITSGLAPSQPGLPDDDFLSSDLLETLTAHNILIPKKSKVVIPEPEGENDLGSQILEDVMHVLTTFKIFPAETLDQFKTGYINPKVEFAEGDWATNPFDKEAEVELTQEEIDQDGPLYTLADALDNALKMSGAFDIIYFNKDESDRDLSLPPRPQGESAKTNFAKKQLKFFPFHEDPENPFVRDADDFYAEYLEKETDPTALMDILNQFYRYDVASTLHEEVQQQYEEALAKYNEETGQADFSAGDLDIIKAVTRDFYLQTALYQNYLADPDPKFAYFNINVDYDTQLQALFEQQSQENVDDDAADAEFVNDTAAAAAAAPPKHDKPAPSGQSPTRKM